MSNLENSNNSEMQYCERYDKACCKRNTNASTMMHLNECILFLALLTIVAKCNPKEQEKKLSARVAGSTESISGTVGHAGFQPTAKWPYSQRIDFNSPFDATPTVTYGLYALDSSDEANLRVSTLLSNVSSTGFQLTLRTWSDSKLFEAAVSWMACGK
uniref:H-type lectin domain-containing protein n=1 Tax=Magallana gigas TaxID=29159 RepID=A0A8W8LFW2_MAGGI